MTPPPTPNEWKRFVLIGLPLAGILLFFLAEGMGRALEDVPLRRHDADKTAVALEHGLLTARTAIIGDSVTQDILKTYRIGAPGQVINLTTNQASGLVGAMFFVKRYLKDGARPLEQVLIAATPEFFSYEPEGKTAELYVTSVFEKEEEKRWIAERLPKLVLKNRWGAILEPEERIGYRLLALMMPRPERPHEGETSLKPEMAVEETPTSERARKDIAHRRTMRLGLSPSARAALNDLCALGKHQGFGLAFLRAPIPASVLEAWEKDGKTARFEAALKTACPAMTIKSATQSGGESDGNAFPDKAFRDADHLRRPGWTNHYALILQQFINR